MKTGILITARLKSIRLPRKVLKTLAGRPLIVHLIDRLKRCETADEIVLMTSTVKQDDSLDRLAQEQGILCFRGHPDDVLVRMRDTALAHGLDYVISCTADNPFVDPVYADRLLNYLQSEQLDFARMKGLPFGAFAYALRTDAIQRACEIKAEQDTEVWGGYFTETGEFRWGELEAEEEAVRWPELRLTVDTPEDFKLAEAIFNHLGHDNLFTLQDIVKLCRQHPELVELNQQVQQKSGKSIKVK